jgi:hypothetical protein
MGSGLYPAAAEGGYGSDGSRSVCLVAALHGNSGRDTLRESRTARCQRHTSSVGPRTRHHSSRWRVSARGKRRGGLANSTDGKSGARFGVCSSGWRRQKARCDSARKPGSLLKGGRLVQLQAVLTSYKHAAPASVRCPQCSSDLSQLSWDLAEWRNAKPLERGRGRPRYPVFRTYGYLHRHQEHGSYGRCEASKEAMMASQPMSSALHFAATYFRQRSGEAVQESRGRRMYMYITITENGLGWAPHSAYSLECGARSGSKNPASLAPRLPFAVGGRNFLVFCQAGIDPWASEACILQQFNTLELFQHHQETHDEINKPWACSSVGTQFCWIARTPRTTSFFFLSWGDGVGVRVRRSRR